MAKHETVSMLVHFGEIIWDHAKNYRQELRGDDESLTAKLVPGWRTTVEPVIAYPVGTLGFCDADIEAAMKYRAERLELLKKEGNLYAIKAWEALYYKNGKMVKPRFMGSSCYSRAKLYPDAIAAFFRVKAGVFDKKIGTSALADLLGEEPTVHVPASIHKFDSELERLDLMIQENGANREGHVAPSLTDNIRPAKTMFDGMYTEARMRDKFGSSNAVKLYGLCFIDAQFPDLKLIDRCLQQPGTVDKIDLAKVDMKKFQEWKQRVEDLAKYRRKNSNAEPLTTEELSAYFADPAANRVVQPKGLTRPQWETVVAASPVGIVKEIAKGHLDNSVDPMKALTPHAEAINLCVELCRAGRMADVVNVLKNLDRCVNFLKVAAVKQAAFEEEQREEEKKHKELCERATADGRTPEQQKEYEASELLANVKSALVVTENIPHGGAKSAKRVK